MQGSPPLARTTRTWQPIATLDLPILLLSIAVQLVLGLFFGHYYDMRIAMATGYLVGTGQNPYIPQNLSAVFNNSAFQGMTSIGYPPPWPLILGFIYRIVYVGYPNLLVYNLAIKLPIILANVGLAYLVAKILLDLGAEAVMIRKAWILMLLSPLLLYFATAWGQFDTIVALLSLSSLVFLDAGKVKSSAVLLALAISFKPIALPILPVALVYLAGKSARKTISYFMILCASAFLFCVVPFIIFGWDPTPILRGWNAQFTVGGGMSYMSFFELLKSSYQLPGQWWLLGLLWIPALGIATLALRPGISGFVELLKKSTALILVFYLTRTWLSEPNIILLLPFVLILTSIGELNPLFLAAIWVFPLVFTIFNTSPPQLLFPSFPLAMANMLKETNLFRTVRLLARILWVIPWQIACWWMVIILFRKNPVSTQST
jgi:hypothetical protein